jgi:BirA family biotin operon repressor/biotin-[acetyl-CoA-carboxylase] ligase
MQRAESWLGCARRALASCDSTNDEAARWAAAGAPHGAIVVAQSQSAGRGRHGRSWQSTRGRDLLMSVVLRPAMPAGRVPGITLAAGIAVCEAVNFFGARASLKWPNDVVAAGGKLAGILTEMSTRGSHVDHVIVGIGINVDTAAEERAAELTGIATSIRIETGRTAGVDAVERRLCGELATWLDRYVDGGGVAAIREAWQVRARLGRSVRVGGVEGVAEGIDDSGALVVRVADGRRISVTSGDVAEAEVPA